MAGLTRAQREMLEVAKRGKPGQSPTGAYLALGGVFQSAGGAKRRMMERLIEAGMLEKDWPWKITPAGRAKLKE